MTLGEVSAPAAEYLERKGVDSPRLDAELLLAQALGLSRLELYTQHDRPLTEAERAAARALVERRGRREPLAYVLGEWGFRRLTLRTDARALVPRPETEIVVERALALDRRGRGAARRRRRHGHAARSRSRSPTSGPTRACVATDVSADALALGARERRAAAASRSSSSRRACSTASTGRSTSSSRTRRTCSPRSWTSCSPRCATGSRALALVADGQTEALARRRDARARAGRRARARGARGHAAAVAALLERRSATRRRPSPATWPGGSAWWRRDGAP